MNSSDQSWLENRIGAAVADDFYLDRDEEKGIKEESASKGFLIADTEVILRSVLDEYGAVSERQLIDTLDHWLHQFTDDDQKLDPKEEKDALDKVLKPAAGKKMGLDPRITEQYVASFCKVNGITRSTDGNKLTIPLISLVALLAVAGIVVSIWYSNKTAEVRSETKTEIRTVIAAATEAKLSDADRSEIDDQLSRAEKYVEAAQFTDPPEKSAKACLDTIRRIDSSGKYRVEEIKGLIAKIVTEYIALSDKSFNQGDKNGAQKWLDRAKLFHAESELIREKERAFGMLPAEG
ncbi:hypothetical protein [Methylobacter psychrophilus]|uniref:hypothetical protein n=1 Tax=Methylobacter psychrophilus TaxID=96941 RepID=UPI0021D4CC5A|nr:hypothetical protein [Methylobacter psychrophilus]